jgi:hypothetical protein
MEFYFGHPVEMLDFYIVSTAISADVRKVSLQQGEETSAYNLILIGCLQKDPSWNEHNHTNVIRDVKFLGSCKMGHFLLTNSLIACTLSLVP